MFNSQKEFWSFIYDVHKKVKIPELRAPFHLYLQTSNFGLSTPLSCISLIGIQVFHENFSNEINIVPYSFLC